MDARVYCARTCLQYRVHGRLILLEIVNDRHVAGSSRERPSHNRPMQHLRDALHISERYVRAQHSHTTSAGGGAKTTHQALGRQIGNTRVFARTCPRAAPQLACRALPGPAPQASACAYRPVRPDGRPCGWTDHAIQPQGAPGGKSGALRLPARRRHRAGALAQVDPVRDVIDAKARRCAGLDGASGPCAQRHARHTAREDSTRKGARGPKARHGQRGTHARRAQAHGNAALQHWMCCATNLLRTHGEPVPAAASRRRRGGRDCAEPLPRSGGQSIALARRVRARVRPLRAACAR